MRFTIKESQYIQKKISSDSRVENYIRKTMFKKVVGYIKEMNRVDREIKNSISLKDFEEQQKTANDIHYFKDKSS